MTKQLLFEGEGTLYQKRSDEDETWYAPVDDAVDVSGISLSKIVEHGQPISYTLNVYQDGEEILEQPIGHGMTLSYCEEKGSVHWPVVIDGEAEELAFRFTGIEGKVPPSVLVRQFVSVHDQCTYSVLTGSDTVDSQDEWFNYLAGVGTYSIPSEGDQSSPVFEFNPQDGSRSKTGDGNICFAQSMQFERVLVVKKTNEDDKVELQAHPLAGNHFRGGDVESITIEGLNPQKTFGGLLDNTDHKLYLGEREASVLREVDLERGVVVQEFDTAGKNVVSFTYAEKTAKDGNVLTCLASNVAFNLDTRLRGGNCIISEDGKTVADYSLSSAKPFTCHATSEAGHLAIGDAAGNIRLYSGPPGARKPKGGHFPKSAKTLLDTKTPILALDITSNGEFIIATCEKFLLFICTKYADDKDGFTSRMGKDKPKPVRLQPSPQQVMSMGGYDAVRLSDAKFDRFATSGERCITASCGPYLLSWSLQAVEQSEETKRIVSCSTAATGTAILSSAAEMPSNVTYLTKEGVGLIPLREKDVPATQRGWTWGKRD